MAKIMECINTLQKEIPNAETPLHPEENRKLLERVKGKLERCMVVDKDLMMAYIDHRISKYPEWPSPKKAVAANPDQITFEDLGM